VQEQVNSYPPVLLAKVIADGGEFVVLVASSLYVDLQTEDSNCDILFIQAF
jgi:hypothetical protein